MNYPMNPVISGSTEGTPITLLRQDVAKKLHNEPINDNESHYSVESIKTTTDIKELVNEINKDIKNKKQNKEKPKKKDTKKQKETDTCTETETDTDTESDTKSDKKESKQNIIEDSIYDGILLLIIYLLMSQDFVKSFLGRYIKLINVNSEGFVPFTGILTYGLIFVLVFLSIRFIIHKLSN